MNKDKLLILASGRWFLPGILMVVTLLLNLNTVSDRFDYDDYLVIVDSDEVKYWHFWDLWHVAGRGVRTLSLMLDYRLFGDSPAGYHIQNILWHLLSVLLLYVIFEKISKDRALAFLGGLFFTIHPVHVESVAYISYRKDLLCMFFYSLSFLSYMFFIELKGNKKWYCLAFSLFTFFLAINSKEVAVTLPIVIAAYEIIFVPREARVLTGRPLLLFSGVIVGSILALVYLTNRLDFSHLGSIKTLGGHSGELSLYSVLATSAPAFWKYLGLLFFPFGLSPDHIIELYQSFINLYVVLSLVAFTIVALSPFFLLGKKKLMAFGILWFLINYIPVSNIIPLTYIVADRYMYLPSAGFSLFMAVFIKGMWDKESFLKNRHQSKTVVTVLTMIIVISFSVKTLRYNALYKDPVKLWEYTVNIYPHSLKARLNLARVNHQSGDYEKAMIDYNYVISMDPEYFPGYYNRAILNKAMGRYDSAVSDYGRVIELNPGIEEAYTNRGNLYRRLGSYDKAIEDFNRAIGINNRSGNAYYNRCVAFYKSGAPELAKADCETSLKINPRFAKAYYVLGLIFKDMGINERAASYFNKAADLGFRK